MTTIQTLQNALQTFIENSKGPRPKNVYEDHHWGMAGIHSALINGLISIYEVGVSRMGCTWSVTNFSSKYCPYLGTSTSILLDTHYNGRLPSTHTMSE